MSTFGDDNLLNLENGTVLATFNGGPQSYIYNPATNVWTQGPDKYYNNASSGDSSAEEGFVELPNGDFLDYCITATNYSPNGKPGLAELYVPASGSTPASWIPTQNLPAGLELSSIADPDYVPELGGGLLLPNGQVFWLGGNGQTGYYNIASNSWTAGPDIPDNLVCDDAPAAEASNGDILFSADTSLYTGPAHVFEYNPTSQVYTDISSEFPQDYLDGPAYIDRELDLPNGQIMFTNSSNQIVLYTPATGSLSANIPTIKSISENSNGSFTLTGTDINGNGDGAAYGDDAQMATNYPIVSFTSAAGQVSYATTYGFNYKVEQASGTLLTTQFTLPTGLAKGTYSVKVIANGAASSSFSLTIPTKANDVPTIATAATATPNPVLTKSTQLSVLGSDTAGESTLTYTWTTTASPAGVSTPTFSVNNSNAAKNDTATFYAVGSYTFQVTATNDVGLSVSSSVTVKVDAALSSLALSPTSIQLAPNQSEQFSVASGLDQFGNQITASSLTWTLTSGNGTLTQSGLYTAPAVGTLAVVTVSSGSVKQSANVYVLTNWNQTDIGSPTTTGDSADNGSGLYTVLGAGTGIGGSGDQFQFAYLPLTGNATVEAQVASIQNTNSAAEAGLTFRNDNSAGSPNVTIAVTPSNGLVFSYRTTENGNTISFSTARVTPGDYLKLIRVGTVFTGYYSTNGTTWTQVNTPIGIPAIGASAEGGLAVTSNSASTLNTSTFNHVLADAVPTIVQAASASPNPTAGTTTALSVLGGDANGESSLTYTWTATGVPVGATAPTFATNGTNASKNDVVTFYKSGGYNFTVTLANAFYTTTSTVNVTVVPTQTTVQLTPLTIGVFEGGTVQFTAAVYDQFGFKMAKQPVFTYSMIAGGAGGKVSSTGLYTAPTKKTGIDYVNVTGAGTASVAKVTVAAPPSGAPTGTKSGVSASVASLSVGWGSDSAALFTASDGVRLLPAGRQTDLPWSGIQTLTIALTQPQPLQASEINVTGVNGTVYGPVTITAISETGYLITLANPIAAADRVTLTIAGSGVTTYTRRLDVLPGDVNGDGVVDATDATLATGYLTTTFAFADVFGDGVVSGKSVNEIQLLNGTKLPLLG